MSSIPIKCATRTITSRQLTTCNVNADGRIIRLGLIEQSGDPVSLELPFEQAASVAMTLPTLLSNALRTQSGNTRKRYVYMLTQWSIERTSDRKHLIITLRTPDGFEVAFSVPFEAARAFGLALKVSSEIVADTDGDEAQMAAGARTWN